jgi:hypothetical protein
MIAKDEALKLALEALESERDKYLEWGKYSEGAPDDVYEAITAIKQALAAPVQPVKPSLWEQYHAAQPAPVQEPVAWRWSESEGERWFGWTTDWSHHDKAKLMAFPIEYAYTTSPAAQRQWVGLTDDELRELCDEFWLYPRKLLQAIEAKLKEKNT